MKTKFISNLADEVMRENQHWKQQYIRVQNRVRDYEAAMLQSLKQASFVQSNIIMDPYQVLQTFCQAFNQQTQHYSDLKSENQSLKIKLLNCFKLNQQSKQIKQQSIKAISQTSIEITKLKKQKEQFSSQLANVKQEFQKYTQNTEAQISQTKKIHQSTVDQINSDHRHRVREIKIQSKQEVMEQNKSLQKQAQTTETILRMEIDNKNEQINKLVSSLSKLRQAESIDQKDLLALQTAMKPYSEYTDLVEKLAQLRKQMSQLKAEKRQIQTKTLQSEIDKQKVMSCNEKLSFELKKCEQYNGELQQQLKKIKAQLVKQIEDKEGLVNYYDRKWTQDFSHVQNNLQKKYVVKKSVLQLEYEEKKQMLDRQMVRQMRENQRIKQQVKEMKFRVAQAEKRTETQIKLRFQSLDRLNELKRSIRQTEQMFIEDLHLHIQREHREIHQLNYQIEDLQYQLKREIQRSQSKLVEQDAEQRKVLYQFKQQKEKDIDQLQLEIQRLEEEKLENKLLTEQFEKKKKAVEEALKIQYAHKIQRRVQQEREVWKKDLQLKNQHHLQAENKLLFRIKELQFKFKDLTLQKEDQRSQYQKREEQLRRSIFDNEQIIQESRKKITEIGAMKSKYERQISVWKQKVQHLDTQMKTLTNKLMAIEAQNYSQNSQIKQLVEEKTHWQTLLRNTKKEIHSQVSLAKEASDNLVGFYKSRVWELEKILGQRAGSQKNQQVIRTLTHQCRRLEQKVQLKEAQNLILNQVKEYYQSKTSQTEFRSTTFGFSQSNNTKSVFVKRPRKRQGLLTLRQTFTQKTEGSYDTKEASDLRKYIKTKQRQLEFRNCHSNEKKPQRHVRLKSSISFK